MVLTSKIQLKILGIIGASITLMVPFFLILFNQNEHLETAQSFCPLKLISGYPCPGCGITKSLVYFYEGDIQKSLYYHILGPFVVLFCLITIVVLSTELITKKEHFNSLLFNRKLVYGLVVFLVTYHLIRIIYFMNDNPSDAILHQSIWR